MIQGLFKRKAFTAILIQVEEHVTYAKFFHMACKIIDVVTTDGSYIQDMAILLLLNALEKQDPAQIKAYVNQACGKNEDLRQRVGELVPLESPEEP